MRLDLALAFALTTPLAMLLAGCSDPSDLADNPGPNSRDDPEEPRDSKASPEGQGVVPELANEMHWSSCFGLFTQFTWPSAANPAPDFDGWAERNPTFTEIRHVIMQCERFGYRQLERGPVQFVLEVTNDRRPPDECLAMEPEGQPLGIIGIWASDPQVVDALVAEGMSGNLADVAFTVETAALVQFQAEWQIDGSASSLQVFQETNDSSTLLSARPWRLFWHNPVGGVSAVDFGHEVKATSFNPERPVMGTLGAPLSMAGPYVGPGFHFTGSDFGGKLTRFRDVECKEPL